MCALTSIRRFSRQFSSSARFEGARLLCGFEGGSRQVVLLLLAPDEVVQFPLDLPGLPACPPATLPLPTVAHLSPAGRGLLPAAPALKPGEEQIDGRVDRLAAAFCG